jgi:hypothetical protein
MLFDNAGYVYSWRQVRGMVEPRIMIYVVDIANDPDGMMESRSLEDVQRSNRIFRHWLAVGALVVLAFGVALGRGTLQPDIDRFEAQKNEVCWQADQAKQVPTSATGRAEVAWLRDQTANAGDLDQDNPYTYLDVGNADYALGLAWDAGESVGYDAGQKSATATELGRVCSELHLTN